MTVLVLHGLQHSSLRPNAGVAAYASRPDGGRPTAVGMRGGVRVAVALRGCCRLLLALAAAG